MMRMDSSAYAPRVVKSLPSASFSAAQHTYAHAQRDAPAGHDIEGGDGLG